MNISSLILTILSVAYIFLGLKVLFADRKSPLNKLFFAMNLALIVWSFATALYIDAPNEAACAFWYKLSSVGLYLFGGLLLHFFLIFAKKDKLLKHWWMYVVLYLPGIFYSYLEVVHSFYVKDYVLGSYGWVVTAQTESVWFWTSLAYIISYIVASIVISHILQITATSQREKKQAVILILTSGISLIVGLMITVLTSTMGLDIPDVTPLTAAIWSIGIYYAIVKYKMMTMTPSIIAENLFETIIDSVVLVNSEGRILNVNLETQRLLGYSHKELVGESLEVLFFSDGKPNSTYVTELLNACPIRNMETFLLSKNGVKIPVILSLSECKDRYGERMGFVLASKDVTEYKLAEEKIQYLATHDSLTGLPNRLMLAQLLDHAIQSAKRHKRKLAVIFIDLDRFKIINDTMGHAAGDQLLQEIAYRYKSSLRAADIVSRQGGDEFVIVIEDFHSLSDLKLVAHNLLAATIKPIILLGNECRVTASIGISIYPQDGEDEQSLLKHADIAMYNAKEEGKNNFQFYSKDIRSQSAGRMAIETNLRSALERNELSLHYQAKVNFKTGTITGVEALLRWQNLDLGSVTPTQFIPVAEETGLIIPIGRWVLKTACAQNMAWQKQGLPPVCMAVNLSLRQLSDNNLIDDIKVALSESGMAPNLLELEVTESMIMSSPTKMMDILVKIKSMGVRLAIDDFGTGYSSLSQLKNYPFNTLKIDRSFIRNVPGNEKDNAITQAIITMGESLGLTVVAEGIETMEQMVYLKKQSCDEMQGFYFSRPVVPEQFAELLRHKPENFAAPVK